MTNPQPDSPEDWKDGETLVQFLSKLQFNAAKWAYMKLHGALDEEDAAAKLFADRQMKAAKIEEYYTNKFLEDRIDELKKVMSAGQNPITTVSEATFGRRAYKYLNNRISVLRKQQEGEDNE